MEAQSLRAAANAPIQGSSADIIKIAMVQLNKKFKEMNVSAKMLLQVHDELLFEVEPDSLEITTKLVKKTMEDCVKLNVLFWLILELETIGWRQNKPYEIFNLR